MFLKPETTKLNLPSCVSKGKNSVGGGKSIRLLQKVP